MKTNETYEDAYGYADAVFLLRQAILKCAKFTQIEVKDNNGDTIICLRGSSRELLGDEVIETAKLTSKNVGKVLH